MARRRLDPAQSDGCTPLECLGWTTPEITDARKDMEHKINHCRFEFLQQKSPASGFNVFDCSRAELGSSISLNIQTIATDSEHGSELASGDMWQSPQGRDMPQFIHGDLETLVDACSVSGFPLRLD